MGASNPNPLRARITPQRYLLDRLKAPAPKVLPGTPEVPGGAARHVSRTGCDGVPGDGPGTTPDRPDGGWYTPRVPTPWVDRPPRRSERLSEAGISVTP